MSHTFRGYTREELERLEKKLGRRLITRPTLVAIALLLLTGLTFALFGHLLAGVLLLGLVVVAPPAVIVLAKARNAQYRLVVDTLWELRAPWSQRRGQNLKPDNLRPPTKVR